MKTITVIRSTGSPMGDMVLSGVYGTRQLAEEGGSGQEVMDKIRVAPEFGPISHLFSYLEDGSAPIPQLAGVDVTVDDEFEPMVKAQLMHALGARWCGLYSGVNPGVPGVLNSMLKGEGAQVARGVKNHLVSMGMRAYLVPIVATCQTPNDGAYFPSERALVAELQGKRLTEVSFDEQGEVIDTGVEMLGQPAAPTAISEELPEPVVVADTNAAPPVAPAWAGFQGITAQVKASFMVVAANAQDARRIAQWVANQHNAENPTLQISECVIESVESVTNRELALSDDESDTGDSGGVDYGRER